MSNDVNDSEKMRCDGKDSSCDNSSPMMYDRPCDDLVDVLSE